MASDHLETSIEYSPLNNLCKSEKSMAYNLLVWDSTEQPEENKYDQVVLWQELLLTEKAISIARLIDDNQVQLRHEYLAWIHRLGLTRIAGKTIREHLEVRPDLSAWWFSLIAEKCNFEKSPLITDAIKLLAFDLKVKVPQHSVLTVATNCHELRKAFAIWCDAKKIHLVFKKAKNKRRVLSANKSIYTIAPKLVQAIIYLTHKSLTSLPLQGVGRNYWMDKTNRISFFTYLHNTPASAIRNGDYSSHYWGDLPGLLNELNYRSRWFHIWDKSSVLKNARAVARTIGKFNHHSNGQQVHIAAEAFIEPQVIIKTIMDWFKYALKATIISGRIRRSIKEKCFLWPLFVEDWKESSIGVTGVMSCLYLNILENALGGLPRQKLGFYLQENIGWEAALIYAWKQGGHGKLIGVPHATIRFWDLRYYSNSGEYSQNYMFSRPLPDKIAVNGKAAEEALKGAGYSAKVLVHVEALRYLHLQGLGRRTSKLSNHNNPINLLVVCDYSHANTIYQLELLERALKQVRKAFKVVIKPHPTSKLNSSFNNANSWSVGQATIQDLIDWADIAYTGSATSAAVEAYLKGTTVITYSDPQSLNMSPLMGRSGIVFVRSDKELARALDSPVLSSEVSIESAKFFNIESDYKMWKDLIRNEY